MDALKASFPNSFAFACDGGARPSLAGMVRLLSRIPDLDAELKLRLPSGARCLEAWRAYGEQLETTFEVQVEGEEEEAVEKAFAPEAEAEPAVDSAPAPPPALILPPLPDQCAPTLRAEAEERLRAVVEANFKTARGLIVLENDLLLFDGSDPAAWMRNMKEDWSSKIHSMWMGEFTNALELWIASRASG